MKYSYCKNSCKSLRQSIEMQTSRKHPIWRIKMARNSHLWVAVVKREGKNGTSIEALSTAHRKRPNVSQRVWDCRNWAEYSEKVVTASYSSGRAVFSISFCASSTCQCSPCNDDKEVQLALSAQSPTKGPASAKLAPFARQNKMRLFMWSKSQVPSSSFKHSAPCFACGDSWTVRRLEFGNGLEVVAVPPSWLRFISEKTLSKIATWLERPK